MNDKPFLAITMGDAAGIGPEVTAKTLIDPAMYEKCRPFVVGNTDAMNDALRLIKSDLKAVKLQTLEDVDGNYGQVEVLDLNNLDYSAITYGQLSEQSGNATVEWILKAGELAATGAIQAICTAPINKEACNLAGHKDIGHMEIFQSQTGAKDVATMLMARQLRVVHLTTHRSLRIACDYVTKENVLGKIMLTNEHFKRWGYPEPRIGVAALNPHASDGGLLGNEEFDEIRPAVQEAKANGVLVEGPVPADTVFNQNIDGKFDVCLAMYHDQGHIPIKVHDWERSVSVNLGLPFIRTSVDHGTAFDIAGKGIADHVSMMESIKVAISLVSDSYLP
jgi:4-hydroxythreonine-4-phosphate dehydrogenase